MYKACPVRKTGDPSKYIVLKSIWVIDRYHTGPTITYDKKLKKALEEFAVVLTSDHNSQIESILSDNKVDLIILEISNANLHEIEIIKIVKTKFPDTEIILIDGDDNQELIAQAFAFGVKDAFRKPHKRDLIVQRIEALLRFDS